MPSDEVRSPDERFARDLAAMSRGAIDVPDDVDRRIRARIRAEIAIAPAPRGFRWRPALAAAAGLTIVVGAWWFFLPSPPDGSPDGSPNVAGVTLTGDYDGSGRVDLLDAYCLMRHLETGGAGEAVGDVNGDGLTNDANVDWIARRAVQLDGPDGRSEAVGS